MTRISYDAQGREIQAPVRVENARVRENDAQVRVEEAKKRAGCASKGVKNAQVRENDAQVRVTVTPDSVTVTLGGVTVTPGLAQMRENDAQGRKNDSPRRAGKVIYTPIYYGKEKGREKETFPPAPPIEKKGSQKKQSPIFLNPDILSPRGRAYERENADSPAPVRTPMPETPRGRSSATASAI